ncbi:hypothetical protein FQA45_01750 [Glutamicibacter halophytocola]|uniref:Uncharacterized protein n=1 Tax=Glutamicibacter halophytocola TaxID=1933880 RepID=A0ABX5Y6Z7_9MICC|nr:MULTISPECIES: hypothetical protein [Glutamicibacter]MBF6671479.1 hypothetical protein [Glutamicibacter sp. FBE19]QDY65131.1 hypothetical protein FQA45_01750 [Glutamicibacter halophytocola]
MDSTEFNYLNLEFIFMGDKPDAAEVVRTALADRRLLGFVGGAVERENSTEVLAEVATVSEARDAVLYRIDAKGKLREGSRVTKLVHELKNSTEADYVLVDGDEIDGPTPDDDILGDLGATNELLHGATLKASELVLAAGFDDNQISVWNTDSGLMAMPTQPVFSPGIARSNRPFLSLARTGNVITATVEAKRPRRELYGPSLMMVLDLERQVILEPETDSPAEQRLRELDALLLGIDEQTVQLLDELVSDPLARDEALGLLQRPVDLAGMKRFVALLGFDPRSVDYLTGRPIPEDRRVISTGGPFRSLRAALSEQEREATGLKRVLFRAGWNPQALIGSGALVLASGLGVHAVLAKSEKFAWLPKPARQLLMLAWYADGAFYLGKGIVDAAKAKRDF